MQSWSTGFGAILNLVRLMKTKDLIIIRDHHLLIEILITY